MKKLLALLNVWEQLPPQLKDAVAKNLPAILGILLAACLAACYLGFCPSKTHAQSPPAAAEKPCCPCSPECTCGCQQGGPCLCSGEPNYGIDPTRRSETPRYVRNGKPCTRDEALDAVTKVPDDAGLLRLTVIGPEAERKRVLDDLSKAPLSDLRKGVLVQDYAPDHWAVQVGFKTDGKPTIYLQAPDGTVLHRQDSYDGPGPLAEAIRKADPNYKPASDPDLNSAGGSVLAYLKKVPVLAWVLAAAGAYILLSNRKKEQQ
jgi:hypothetical protein